LSKVEQLINGEIFLEIAQADDEIYFAFSIIGPGPAGANAEISDGTSAALFNRMGVQFIIM